MGNPPFAGKNTISASSRHGFADWLKEVFKKAHGNSDLVAYFYRTAFQLLNSGGAFGLIATNSIGEGDTRTTGLKWICDSGGTIYEARRRIRWPGVAAVVVSVVHVKKSGDSQLRRLDGKPVPLITAFLFHRGGNEDPFPLSSNTDKCFVGYGIYGPGFTFDDSHSDASPIAEMERLLAQDSSNATRVFPYIGGQSFLNDPLLSHSRYVISFGQMTLEQAEQWPELLGIVRDKVKPYRDGLPPTNNSNRKRREFWWQFGAFPKRLDTLIGDFETVMMHPFTSSHLAFGLIPASTIVAAPHNTMLLNAMGSFAVLQSRTHESWARFFGSSLKDDMRYTASDCFDTFPFPVEHESNYLLEADGRNYYELRSNLMIASEQGLTKTYNRFHSPEEVDEGILELRRLHGLMDGAVLRAYGWDDLAESAAKSGFCEFLLDYEEEDDDSLSVGKKKSKKKKPWRYRWPDDFRDEVLARLLELNEQRHKEEVESAKAKTKPKAQKKADKMQGKLL